MARSHIESALKWEDTPDKVSSTDHYGDILIKLGMKNEAREHTAKPLNSARIRQGYRQRRRHNRLMFLIS